MKGGLAEKKYTKQQVYKAYTSIESSTKLGKELNMPAGYIKKIRTKKSWAWYTDGIDDILAKKGFKIAGEGFKRAYIKIN